MTGLSAMIAGLHSKMDSAATTSDERFTKLESTMSGFNDRIVTLENRVGKPSAAATQSICVEIQERETRAKNIIVYDLAEKPVGGELAKINDILKEVTSQPVALKIFRLGKNPSRNKPRPLKVVFQTKEEAKEALRSRDIWQRHNLQAKNDSTLLERQYLKELRHELDTRIQAGATDLTLKYVRGVPTIVPKNA